MPDIDFGDNPVGTPPTIEEQKQIHLSLNIGNSGKMIWVDAINGSDTTGSKNFEDWPYATIQSALSVALSGDIVVVRPGDYDECVVLGDGQHLHMMDGARVVVDNAYDIINFPDICWALRVESGHSATVSGNGEFVVLPSYVGDNYTGTNAAVEFLGSGNINFEAKRVQFIGDEVGSRTAIYCEKDGNIIVNDAISDYYDAFILIGSNLTINCHRAQAFDNIIEGGIQSGHINIDLAETTSVISGGLLNHFYGSVHIGHAKVLSIGSILGTPSIWTSVTIEQCSVDELPTIINNTEQYCCAKICYGSNIRHLGNHIFQLNSYSSHNDADADSLLPINGLYKLNSDRVIYQKP